MTEQRAAESTTAPARGLGERMAPVLLLLVPAVFAANIIVGRATVDIIPPVALAFWRWAVTFILLLPLSGAALWRGRRALKREGVDLLVLGALGMGASGAFVYIGILTTTATNTGFIYGAAPVLIVLLSRFIYGEPLSRRQLLGAALALSGVFLIVCRADPAVLMALRFTVGDLWIVAAAIGWAVYSVMLRHRPSAFNPQDRLTAICGAGVLILLPFLFLEMALGQVPSFDRVTVGAIAFLAVFSSLFGFLGYAAVQRALGAGPTGLTLYLIPLYNVAFAITILGERLELYHALGFAAVLPGIYLATHRPASARPPA